MNYRDATFEDLLKLSTRKLLALRDDCYRNNSVHDPEAECATIHYIVIGTKKNEKYDPKRPEGRGNRATFEIKEGIRIGINALLSELRDRPHVPGKLEAKKIRQERAKAGT